MWLAFHSADAVSVGETTSWARPMLWRCWLTSCKTWPARERFGAGQPLSRTQFPTVAAAGGAVAAGTTNAATRAARQTATRDTVSLMDLGPPRAGARYK